mgnify:CR=1 FL=1
MPDIVCRIIEVSAVIADKTDFLDTLSGMFDAVAVDAGIKNGNPDRRITGGDVPPLRCIDIGIGYTVALYRIAQEIK